MWRQFVVCLVLTSKQFTQWTRNTYENDKKMKIFVSEEESAENERDGGSRESTLVSAETGPERG